MNQGEEQCERAIRMLLDAASVYCHAYSKTFDGSLVGNDFILGAEGVVPLLHAIRTLLDGPTGKLDCARASAQILELAERFGMGDEFR